MLKNLQKNLNKLVNLGVSNNQTNHETIRIKAINVLNLVSVFFILLRLTVLLFSTTSFPVAPITTFFLLSLLSLYLCSIHKIMFAFLIFTINSNCSIFYINQYYPFEVGSYLFYFPLLVGIILLSNIATSKIYTAIHVGITAFFIFLFLTFKFPNWTLTDLSKEEIHLLWVYNIVFAVSITAILSWLLNWLIAKQNIEIISQNDSLKATQEELSISLKEKEVLLSELHHRVKNNLAIVTGLLKLQENVITNTDAKSIIGEIKNRIMSMALVHKMLYNNTELKSIELSVYCKELISELFYSYNLSDKVSLKEEYQKVSISMNNLISLGLILNEIVTNSIKYGFTNIKNDFYIGINFIGNHINITLKDSGVGFDKDYNTDVEANSLGIDLIKSLTKQIDGTIFFSNEFGAKIEITIPIE